MMPSWSGGCFRRRMQASAARIDPDWSHIHTELKRRGVTLALLWQEYRAEHAQGYAYSWFCERYSDWRKCITPTMRQTHLAGEKLFVDWAGDTIPVFDPITAPSMARTSSSRRSARPTTPTPRRAGPRCCPTGSARM